MGSHAFEDELILFDSVDQDPVGFDVAVPSSREVSHGRILTKLPGISIETIIVQPDETLRSLRQMIEYRIRSVRV